MDPSKFPNNNTVYVLRTLCYCLIVFILVLLLIVAPVMLMVEGWPLTDFIGAFAPVYVFGAMAISIAWLYLKGSKR